MLKMRRRRALLAAGFCMAICTSSFPADAAENTMKVDVDIVLSELQKGEAREFASISAQVCKGRKNRAICVFGEKHIELINSIPCESKMLYDLNHMIIMDDLEAGAEKVRSKSLSSRSLLRSRLMKLLRENSKNEAFVRMLAEMLPQWGLVEE